MSISKFNACFQEIWEVYILESEDTFTTLIEKFEFAEEVYEAITSCYEMVDSQYNRLLGFENEKKLRGLDSKNETKI